jgi:hypothetical protein
MQARGREAYGSRDDEDHRSRRGVLRSSSGDDRRATSPDSRTAHGDLHEGLRVEARYQGHGAWYEARVTKVNADRSVDVVYHDGEAATGLHHSTVRPFREGRHIFRCCSLLLL